MTKRIRMFFVAAAVVSALCGSLFAQPAGSPVAKHGKLSVSGNRIVNKDGEPVALRGMSFYWDRSDWNGHQFYTAGTVNTLAGEWKVDIVRAAYSAGSGDASKLKTVVDAAIDKGIYVIIDWHSHNAHNELSAARAFFEGHAESYKNTPNVIFEIYNEPDTKESPCTWAQVKTYANSVVSAIRGKGAENIILIGTRDYSKRVDEATADPVTGTNLAYVIHFYTAEPGTQHQSDLRTWANIALNRGYALFASEWGVTEASGKGNTDLDEARRWFEYLDRNSIGWCNWSVSAFEESSALTSGNGDGSGWVTRNPGGTFVKQALIDYGTKTYTVTVTKSGEGEVKSIPAGPSFQHGAMVTLEATPAAGWVFERWSGTDGASLGVKNPATFSAPLYSNKSVQAVFGQGSMIKNGTFTNNIEGWNNISVTLAHEDGTLKITVTGATAAVRQTGLSLESNKKYTLSFRAKAASGNVAVTPRITNNAGSTAYWEGEPITLTSAWQKKDFEICMSATDANAQIRFQTNNQSGVVWNLDDVKLDEAGACQSTSVLPGMVSAQRSSWSVARAGGALQLRGPVEAGARVSLYDVRGKVVRSIAAADGLTFGAGIPAGSYFVVVKNRAGGEVLRTKVVVAK